VARRPRFRGLIAKTLALFVVIAAGVGIFTFWQNREKNPESDDATIDADVVHVAPSVTGQIVRLAVSENQLVKEGDVLFEIDPEPYRLRVDLGKAELDAAVALLDTQRRTVATESSHATIAGDQVTQARTSLELATHTLNRLEPLLSKGYVSVQQVDDARTAKQKAETALVQALEEAASTKTAIGTTDSAVASVAARRATLALAERDLRNTVVRAPHDGRITGLSVKSGEYVALAQSLFTLIVTDEWFASANFRETVLKHIDVGTCATVYSLIDRNIPIHGKVISIGWGVSDQERINIPRGVPYVAKSVNWVRVEQRFPVRIRLENPPENLMRLGASAVVRVKSGGDC
jgi:membrane fusion protein, multidrug efflux system